MAATNPRMPAGAQDVAALRTRKANLEMRLNDGYARIGEAGAAGTVEKQRIAAWEDFVASRKDRPYPIPEVGPEGEGEAKQRDLEERYFSGEMLKKYK